MARGNPNFKKKEFDPENLTPEPIEPVEVAPVEVTDETIVENFATLAANLKAVMKVKAAKNRPSRHYFAISQQVEMWGRNFQKTLR